MSDSGMPEELHGTRVELKTEPSEITEKDGIWILHFPRLGEEGKHFHSYGMLTPYFDGLAEGRLMATRCVDPDCPISGGDGEMWLPPRADCPDCHRPMEWQEVEDLDGTVYAYTLVKRGGTGLEIDCPYYQIDVRMQGVCTIVKSYLVDRQPIEIGTPVRARFRTGDQATHTCLDLYFELA